MMGDMQRAIATLGSQERFDAIADFRINPRIVQKIEYLRPEIASANIGVTTDIRFLLVIKVPVASEAFAEMPMASQSRRSAHRPAWRCAVAAPDRVLSCP
jgi:hypothetical protein